MSVTQRLRLTSGSALKTLSLTVGTLAMARISPLRGSMTMATADLAPLVRTVCLSTSSAAYWMVSSRVRRTVGARGRLLVRAPS